MAPEGLETRPTSGRLRENLFNILAPRIIGAFFLDLFSGSGAMGIEALSRGAEVSVFVEKAPKAVAVIKKNLEKTKLEGSAEIFPLTVSRAIAELSKREKKFDIIFMDPPYESDYAEETLNILANADLLAPNGIVAAELPAHSDFPEPVGFKKECVKVYGDKKFIIWTGDL